MIVIKFGGSSISNSKNIEKILTEKEKEISQIWINSTILPLLWMAMEGGEKEEVTYLDFLYNSKILSCSSVRLVGNLELSTTNISPFILVLMFGIP